MEIARTYLNKHSPKDSLIQAVPEKGLKYIVVIPAYLETSLEESLVSLYNASFPSDPVEIIVLVNWPENESRENIQLSNKILKSAQEWARLHSSVNKRYHIIEVVDIPRKKAGVGFVRKTGMDETIRRFLRAEQPDGIIISFDADSKCSKDYLTAIESHFQMNPLTDGCSVYFEHPLEGLEYPEPVYHAIIQYELHMRYYLNSVRYSGFPNAYYTVGSAFAVKSSSYCRQGGMNIRKAGEDFYFLQKLFDLGNFSELNSAIIYPSPRPSFRVPFGTGKTVDVLLKSGECLKSFNPAIFDILIEFFAVVPDLYNKISQKGYHGLSGINPRLIDFLEDSDFNEEILNIYKNSSGFQSFSKRFFRYFNMFRILKFAKYARKHLPDLPVRECAEMLMIKTGLEINHGMSEKDMLLVLRNKDRGITGQQ